MWALGLIPAKKRSDLTRSDLGIVIVGLVMSNNLKVYFASVDAILMVDDFEQHLPPAENQHET